MENYFGILILVLILFSLWRTLHSKVYTLKFKYSVYKLRDKLRLLAIKKEVDKNTWIYEHLDRSFTKSIDESYYITLLRLVLLSFAYSNNKKYDEFVLKLDSELEANPVLNEIQKEYHLIIRDYVHAQHHISLTFIVRPIVVPIVGATNVAKHFNQWLKTNLVFNESSEHAHLV